MGQWNPITEVRTKIAGTSSGDDAKIRQLALKTMSEMDPKRRPRYLDLVPDPDNEYDTDAIQVIVELPDLGRVQLGFVKNSDTICDFCKAEYGTYPRSNICAKCGRNDHLRRDGLASRLCRELEKDQNTRFYAELLEVTGGQGDKANYGCNIVIRKVFRKG